MFCNVFKSLQRRLHEVCNKFVKKFLRNDVGKYPARFNHNLSQRIWRKQGEKMMGIHTK